MQHVPTRKLFHFSRLCLATTLTLGSLISTASFADSSSDIIAQGKQLTFDRKKGNCLACHIIDDGTLAGNGGPPLVSMKIRFPDASRLRAQIWDATANNPSSIMPPFGRHGILSEDEIDKVITYLFTL